jgi:ribosomal protein L11 methyltransferase
MIRLAVRCDPAEADVVLAELTVVAPNGVEEERGEGYVEYAIYGAEGELPALGEVEAAAGDALVEVVATEIPEDWADRWQDFHKPLLAGGRLWLRPSWEPQRRGAIDVVVDPGRAFGTGAHPTTRLCLELLLELEAAGEAGGPLTDLGCGSGVLAIAAAKLGWSPVRGYDHEPPAVEAATANAAANGIAVARSATTRRAMRHLGTHRPPSASFERRNLRRDLPELAPTVVANMTAPVLRDVAALLTAETAPRTLICSGLLPAELDAAAAAFGPTGLAEVERRIDGDWAALLLRCG